MTEDKFTKLLPPVAAVSMVWARTGNFSADPHSQISSSQIEMALKNISDRADGLDKERAYIVSAVAAMDAGYRNLDIIHKKRNQDFEQNEKLRSAYFQTVKDNIEFGTRAKDFLKSVPALTIGGASGLTLAEALGLTGTGIWPWVFGLSLAGAGYLINLLAVRLTRKRKQMLYVLQDYELGLYYEQYVNRSLTVLASLYNDIGRIHLRAFGESYPADTDDDILQSMFNGIRTNYCTYIHKHMRERKITAGLWPTCEVGEAKARQSCPFWEQLP